MSDEYDQRPKPEEDPFERFRNQNIIDKNDGAPPGFRPHVVFVSLDDLKRWFKKLFGSQG